MENRKAKSEKRKGESKQELESNFSRLRHQNEPTKLVR